MLKSRKVKFHFYIVLKSRNIGFHFYIVLKILISLLYCVKIKAGRQIARWYCSLGQGEVSLNTNGFISKTRKGLEQKEFQFCNPVKNSFFAILVVRAINSREFSLCNLGVGEVNLPPGEPLTQIISAGKAPHCINIIQFPHIYNLISLLKQK